MHYGIKALLLLWLPLSWNVCQAQQHHQGYDTLITVGAARMDQYLPLLEGKRVALLVNQTSMVGSTRLVDTLRSRQVKVIRLFTPEHGLKGAAAAGAGIHDGTDSASGLPVISLYGNHNRPTLEDLKEVEVVVFDLQDVGARFYTYISTLSYLMEGCAIARIPLLVLDRPNPNGFYVDGPVLQRQFASFVGMHQVPVVHGMTVGEYARMLNGEHWLHDSLQCDLTVIPCAGYTHHSLYRLPVSPSPNLPNMTAVYLYPSICLFEGCSVSLGRGTNFPFQVVGYPAFPDTSYSFTPHSRPAAPNPPFQDQRCYGYNLSIFNFGYFEMNHRLMLEWLLKLYQDCPNQAGFFNAYFDKLAGTDQLRKDIIAGKTEAEIVASWQPALKAFKVVRKKYLLYPDFE